MLNVEIQLSTSGDHSHFSGLPHFICKMWRIPVTNYLNKVVRKIICKP